MRTVDEVIASWTNEEREQHKDLINECRERQQRLMENIKIRDRLLKAVVDDRLGQYAEILYHLTSRRDAKNGRA